MGSRDERKKASDLFREGGPVFGRKAPFDEVFPGIDEIRVEVRESGAGVWADDNTRVYTRAHLPGEYVDCSNPLCYGGGVSVGALLRGMVYDRRTTLEETKMCKGYEGSPKGRRRYGRCTNMFHVRIDLTYSTSGTAGAQAKDGTPSAPAG